MTKSICCIFAAKSVFKVFITTKETKTDDEEVIFHQPVYADLQPYSIHRMLRRRAAGFHSGKR